MGQSAKNRRITLALGGGGARGVAHLGVIEVLSDAGFEIDRIVGVSMGSLVGAMCAFEPDARVAQKRALDYLLSPSFQRHQRTLFGIGSSGDDETGGGLFSWYGRVKDYLRANRVFHRVIRKPALLPGVVLRDVVNHLLPEADIADATIPLSIVSVDLVTGHRVIFENGPLQKAVRASASLPGIFPPVEFDGMQLCDVGVFNSLPSSVARSYTSNCLVGIDVSSDLKRVPVCETAFDVMMRMDEIGESLFRKHVRDAADLIIRPKVSGIEWFDFSTCIEVIEAGRVAAQRALPELEQICNC